MFDSIRGPDPARAGTPPAAPAGPAADAAAESASVVLARLAAAPPSAAGLAELDAVDVDTLRPYDRVVALQLWERHAAWLAGRTQAAIVAVGGAEPPTPPPGVWTSHADDWAREEIGCALRLSALTAGKRLAVARELTGRLQMTGAALTAGALGYLHAQSLAEATSSLDDQLAAVVEATVLAGGAPDETLARFRQRLARVLIAAAPQDADTAHADEIAQRRVVLDPQPHAMAWLSAYLTAAEALTAMAHLNAAAGTGPRPAPGVDDQPADVRRADAFLALLTGAPLPSDGDAAVDRSAADDGTMPGGAVEREPDDTADDGQSGDREPGHGAPDPATGELDPAIGEPDPLVALCTPTRVFRPDGTLTDPTGGQATKPARGRPAPRPGRRAAPARPVIQVTVDLPTLLGLAEHPGELAGYGPIPPTLTRQLAADGDWQRLVTDPLTGHLLDLGRTTYRPTDALAQYIRARDRTCRFPGCPRKAEHCDLDHACPWEQLGLTCPANLGPLCRRHHRLKTHAGWQLESHPDGAATFTSPAGHTYPRHAINHNPEHTARQQARLTAEHHQPDDPPPDTDSRADAEPGTDDDPPPF